MAFRTSFGLLPSTNGQRLDQMLANLFPQFSRNLWQQWIASGQVCIDGLPRASKYRLNGNEICDIQAVLPQRLQDVSAQSIPLNIIYEDQALLVVNKPAGMVVHPGAGICSGTLMNALLGYDSGLSPLPRAGIVHRLDKDTSGLLLVAKNLESYHKLNSQLQARAIKRDYLAVCENLPISGGSIDKAIARHPRHRLKMQCFPRAIAPPNARHALTHFRIRKKFTAHALLAVSLESGRTHQIRVHLASTGYPLVGDRLYGWRGRTAPGMDAAACARVRNFMRQALHAVQLGFEHPENRQFCAFTAPVPSDMETLIHTLS